ncbi:hypothetical protein PENANT_c010G09855 [Penicillium antarcticum]|uniref:Ca2+-modulated nonselective cation channel polycystin n=2 Tax=Penicillium antarcticum TaxID=416450 RepID=A0A1V6Q929_9EURO|nr:hypothetical protein PENANT_c010G09855 [Penicillium antarcticum]
MATAEVPARVHDRNARRRPFSSWMKRLANLKSSSDSTSNRWSNKRHLNNKGKKSDQANNPYPLSGTINRHTGNQTPTDSYTDQNYGSECRSQSGSSMVLSNYDNPAPITSAKSNAPTISTNGDTTFSEAAYSKAGTLATGTEGQGGGEGSTFSSPAPSVRSLTTTLTTVHSAAPSTQLYHTHNSHHGHHNGSSTNGSTNQQIQFSHQFPSTSSPATAVPSHLVPHHSMTYSTATANNVLTDNASLLTLASSSKRRRRNSLDTNASVRGLAPSSVFGGSRESLPLSVLSANTNEASNTSVFNASGVLSRPSIVGLASAERISVYSASGATPLATSAERTGFYTAKQPASGDGASIRSGVQSHSRNDSTAASIMGGVSSPLALTGRMSRRSSGWGEITGEEDNNEDKPAEMKEEDEPSTEDENGLNETRNK